MIWGTGSVLYLPKRDDYGNFCAQEELLTPIRSRDKLLHKCVRPKKGRGHLRARDHFTEYLPEPNMFLMGPLK